VRAARPELQKARQGRVAFAGEGREEPASGQVERVFRSVLQKVNSTDR